MKGVAVSFPSIMIVVAVTLCGCAELTRQDAVPPRLTQRALTPEASDTRYWPNLDQSRAVKIAVLAAERERESLIETGRLSDQLPPENHLAISSGGDDGAFAAGLLVGWSARGGRPVFNVVTGGPRGGQRHLSIAVSSAGRWLGPQYCLYRFRLHLSPCAALRRRLHAAFV